jgi:ribosomal protein S18 acetylase RimI-like enzyme
LVVHRTEGKPVPDIRAISTEVSFERATAADHEWLYRLHEQAHRELVERAYGPWEEGQQRDFFRPLVDDHEVHLITADQERVGAVYLGTRGEDVWLELVEVAPDFQRRGIGASALRWVATRAAEDGKGTLLQVHRVNEDARRLYRSEGFVDVSETDTHFLLRMPRQD